MPEDSASDQKELLYPKIRAVETSSYEDENQQGICLRDPQRIATNVLIVPPPLFFILTLFDGKHSFLDIQEAFMRQFGHMLPQEDLERIIQQLDDQLFMETENYRQALRQIEEEFHQATYREAAHAGTAYEGDPVKLKSYLDGLLNGLNRQSNADLDVDLSLLIAPHIDLHRGGACFASAYREALQSRPADLYLVFGTAHQSSESLFVFTRKSYETPLGVIETNADFVDSIASQASQGIFQEELLHRDEHSIEFQMLWLRHVLKKDWKGQVVPILCGSFHSYIQEGVSPRSDKDVARMLDLIRSEIESYPGRVTVIAGVDFSHVGKKFGSKKGIPESELKRVEKDDQDVIEAIQTGDAETFFSAIEKNKDCNNVCGLSPIYMALDVVHPHIGRLIQYDKALEQETESIVTFASLAFYK